MAKTGKIVKPVVCFHPGETLKEKLQEMGISNKEFAAITSINEEDVILITNCKLDINENIALALEKGTGIPKSFWLKKQEKFNFYCLNKLAQSIVNDVKNYDFEKKPRIRQTINKMSKLSEAIA
ncbi:MAG: hypothetical protein IKO99_08220 [Bacteroidales bacterium]|nr:hypothetical protein [Bacteroidales bacterium]